MCGIIGWIGGRGATPPKNHICQKALFKLSHRGPDSTGEWKDGTVWLGHCRLSILDLTKAGSQPMMSQNKEFVLTYNGEIYNHHEIRKNLSFHNWRGESDSETLLNAFLKEGVSCIKQLNGMFAFVIYNRRHKEIFLVRDRLGIKPLYVYRENNIIAFCSEILPLFELIEKTPACEQNHLSEWFAYGNALGGRTLFRNVEQVLPGEIWRININNMGVSKIKYWSLSEKKNVFKSKNSAWEAAHETKRLLEKSVQRQLLSDVPVGVFLSGGIDSSAITAIAAKVSPSRIRTFTAGFGEPGLPDERMLARKTAREIGTDHEEFYISGEKLPEVMEDLVDHHGAPFSDAANVPLYLMAKQVSKKVKVILQGDGGDEIFGGYRRYTTLAWRSYFQIFSKLGKNIVKIMPASPLRQRIHRYVVNYHETDPGKTIARLLSGHGPGVSAARLFPGAQINWDNAFNYYLQKYNKHKKSPLLEIMSKIDMEVILPDIFLAAKIN